MARPRKASSAPQIREPASATSRPTPRPPVTLHVTPWTLPRKQVLHRIHQERYAGGQFNPGLEGNARFSPIRNAKGAAIPTLYAAVTFNAAAMETVFHDVSHAPGFKYYDRRKLTGLVYSPLEVKRDLTLTDLSSVALRKLGVPRKLLIDTEKDQYPTTRLWAEAVHAQHPQIQGLSWISRQDDSARAVMLFGDRIPRSALRQMGDSRSLVQDEGCYLALLDLAERIGVEIASGKEQQ